MLPSVIGGPGGEGVAASRAAPSRWEYSDGPPEGDMHSLKLRTRGLFSGSRPRRYIGGRERGAARPHGHVGGAGMWGGLRE
jgi:hypothetical protein